jgi:uncharacterized protein
MHEANDVATELARKFKLWIRGWRGILLAVLLVWFSAALVVYRFSPKDTVDNCAFKIPTSAVNPETKGDAYKLDQCVRLEEASSNSERVLGLSGRKSMPKNSGMLFDFARPAEYCMWMKDMHFALDMIWLNSQQELVYMIEDVTPETYPKSFCGPKSARYVVEVGSGIVRAGDLRIGQRLRF